ncbi:putative kinesin heavy chain [Leishmania braziliensis MHOM/BR/75/M2904]|uniref:Kinesin heavy chain n=2 Tax=Leishmania braziliensis TaxID=5660 RepID=E9AIC0_LEIBR|nr:putative kinesin heavy chain [Leishmania braziliensis MHOM/BR/75/M2904]KAI5686738.1 Kinesin motor domain containing protein [Leishmania braziliensis]CAJ2471945.1 unnamed protein product [Leishmania braziliensis]CBZ14564.1 putative kinesin heavy chain [Leishmania braziliensis MHOM/BR/75/M2904]SYZ65508.1 kinesin_heavy_chain [Leishmania braziliensis MHOM/BR/75/M2904]
MYGQTGSGKTHTMFGDLNGGAWTTGCGSGRTSAAVASNSHNNEEDVKEKLVEDDSHARTPLSEEEPGEVESYPYEHQKAQEEEDEERQHEPQQQQAPQQAFHAVGISLKTMHPGMTDYPIQAGHRASSALATSRSTATASPPPTATTSFCRTRATVTPLGELLQVNALQNTTDSNSAEHFYVAVNKSEKMFAAATAVTESTSCAPPPAPRSAASSSSAFSRSELPRSTAKSATGTRSAFTGDAVSGVIPRAVHDIFDAIARADPSKEFDVQMFFVEVYMEQIRDLLVPNSSTATPLPSAGFAPTLPMGPRKLQLREDVNTNSFYVDGCRSPHVSSARDVLHLVKRGLKHRATSATAMNETSSRSHCLLNLTVKSVDRTQGVSTVGKLYLVDLAGSEKVSKTNAKGMRLEEAKLINKSLTTLGMVIMSLTDHNATHTPYRDSVLTKILKDSLGGNSHTALVLCCSPSPYNAPETLSTLRFGARAKAIKNKAVVNRDLTAAQLRRMLETAKAEIERLHVTVQQLSMTNGVTSSCQETPDFPVAASRKLSSSTTATASPKATETDTFHISKLLEERATEQARLQNLRAEVAQLQDSLNGAQDIISALQEERDGYIDKAQSFQEEVSVWEEAHTASLKRAAIQNALLQQCAVLLRTQGSEIKDLTQRMEAYSQPLQQARQAVDQLHAYVFGTNTSRERRQTLLTAEACQSDAITAASQLTPAGNVPLVLAKECALHGLIPYPPASVDAVDVDALGSVTEDGWRRDTNSNLPDGESPNPRRHPGANADPLQPSSSQPQPQHRVASQYRDGFSSGSISVSPGTAAAQQWLSRTASAGEYDNGALHVSSCGGGSTTPAAPAECVRRLEERLSSLQSDHTALQQQYKELLAELQSKQRILDLRGSHLITVKDELKREYMVNKELRERLEKDRDSLRGPLEMARNDANYWRRRYEELASRKAQPRFSECQRDSLLYAFSSLPPPPQQHESGRGSLMNTDSLKATAIHASEALTSGDCTTAGRNCPSIPDVPSGGLSSRASGEDVLLSLSSSTTPLRSTVARLTTEREG